jgi:hypothetical protein
LAIALLGPITAAGAVEPTLGAHTLKIVNLATAHRPYAELDGIATR